ncbi:MAG: Nif3-like dinuclear metal center hexameric protein [Eubacterium sp.]|nr:Nif3-like dinuclear metal center hexameric protein [Eubacterium sp.]
MTTVKNIYDYINCIAPFDTQEEWDNAGFLLGEFRKEVKKAVFCLDVTKAVAQYATDINADLIISHHPVIFNGIKNVIKGSAVYTCIENDIAVISAHTNFDLAESGINHNLAVRLGLKDIRQIDGSFLAVGNLDYEMSIDDFAQFVSDTLEVNGLRYTDTEKPVKTIAVGGGACEEYTELAMQYADCFVTGDMKYHAMLECAENGYAVISAGHYETEHDSFIMLMDKLKALFTDVEFLSANQKNPVLAV